MSPCAARCSLRRSLLRCTCCSSGCRGDFPALSLLRSRPRARPRPSARPRPRARQRSADAVLGRSFHLGLFYLSVALAVLEFRRIATLGPRSTPEERLPLATAVGVTARFTPGARKAPRARKPPRARFAPCARFASRPRFRPHSSDEPTSASFWLLLVVAGVVILAVGEVGEGLPCISRPAPHRCSVTKVTFVCSSQYNNA